ncbi:MAG TPA: ABC transporter permease, partial [Thermotogota bacterium]|nr:ABC transporter permease [Thermotogota bacterium]
MENIKRFFKIKKAIAGLIILFVFICVSIFAPYIAPYEYDYMDGLPMQGPCEEHLLGTTNVGQDILSLVIWSTRSSLTVGLMTGLLTTCLAVIMGLTSGYFGSVTDDILSLIMNIFLVIPGLPLMIIIAAYIPVRGTGTIVMVLAFTGWAWGARVLRSQMLSLKNQEFVNASVVLGESSSHIIFKDIFPN